tara:strand:+ start:1106 stop:2170 length:1065 start_codon:yes stop_codon:yes gene_type:complete
MSEIEIPNTPGKLVSKWRSEGPVDNLTLAKWKAEMEIESWLMVAEAALFLDAAELFEQVIDSLTPAEKATIGLVRRRMLGDNKLEQAIDDAIKIATDPETRDLKLEGRLRMERGLARFENGNVEGAKDDLEWAELRLKSVAKASRDHDLSLLNRAALLMATDAPLMALHVYSEITRDGDHAHETIAISRIGASRIRASLGHMFDAARHAWNAHEHAIKAYQTNMAIEAGTLFLELSLAHIDHEAERMMKQVKNAKPRKIEDPEPILSVNPQDIDGVFDWCLQNLPEANSGEHRPDLRAMVSIAKNLNKLDSFSSLFAEPDEVEDPTLAAMIQVCSEDEEHVRIWGERLSVLTLI